MEERELTQLLQQLGDRETPGPAPLRRIVDDGEALRGRRSGRVRMFAVAAAAAAVVGGGSVAAVVLDLPSSGGSGGDSTAGEAAVDAGSGAAGGADAGAESAPEVGVDRGETDEGVAAADGVAALVVTPDVVQPGDQVTVTPRDTKRSDFGLPWRLEIRTADGWSWEYTLVAAVGASGPTWAPAEEELILEQPLVSAPVTLVIPLTAAQGDYRICQEDGTEDLCGAVTVTG